MISPRGVVAEPDDVSALIDIVRGGLPVGALPPAQRAEVLHALLRGPSEGAPRAERPHTHHDAIAVDRERFAAAGAAGGQGAQQLDLILRIRWLRWAVTRRRQE